MGILPRDGQAAHVQALGRHVQCDWRGGGRGLFQVLPMAAMLVALGLLMSLTGWVKQDLSQSLMSLINTVVSVALHPVGDAVIQLS